MYILLTPGQTVRQHHSIALVVPDHTDKQYIEAMFKVLLQFMGFRQVGLLQVSSGPYLISTSVADDWTVRSKPYARPLELDSRVHVSSTLARNDRP